jgi:hypothetical protein
MVCGLVDKVNVKSRWCKDCRGHSKTRQIVLAGNIKHFSFGEREREARVSLYTERAAQGLPLFDTPTSIRCID